MSLGGSVLVLVLVFDMDYSGRSPVVGGRLCSRAERDRDASRFGRAENWLFKLAI